MWKQRRTRCDGEGRDCGYVAASQGVPKIASRPPEARKKEVSQVLEKAGSFQHLELGLPELWENTFMAPSLGNKYACSDFWPTDTEIIKGCYLFLGLLKNLLCNPLEEERATHSSTLAWEIPWTVEPGRLLSMGSQSVGHDWATEPTTTTAIVHMLF